SSSPSRRSPCVISSPPHHRHLHSFPTRRSSDLLSPRLQGNQQKNCVQRGGYRGGDRQSRHPQGLCEYHAQTQVGQNGNGPGHQRSEEHTSELQSRFDLVCRLLLEKKKTPDATRI